MIFKMDWKRELIDKYNDNYDKVVMCPPAYKYCDDISGFEEIDKDEFAKYVELSDSKQLHDECGDFYTTNPVTDVVLLKIFSVNYLCYDTHREKKIKLHSFNRYIKNVLSKLFMLERGWVTNILMAREVVDRSFSECLVCGCKDYAECHKMFVCCECAKMCSDNSDEFGVCFQKGVLFYNKLYVYCVSYGHVKRKDIIDNAHKLICRCKYVDCDSVVLFVMARDELGLLMDVVKVIVGFVYC